MPRCWSGATSRWKTPRDVTVLGVELRVSATTTAGVMIRGIIDRLELDADGELVVTDYKTGSAPSEGWEQKSMAGVHIYSLLCERMFGRRPARVQLLYLSKPERIITAPSDQSLRGVEVKTERGDAGGAPGVHARRLPAPHVRAVQLLLVPGVLSRVRRATRARPAHVARPASRTRRPAAAAARLCMTLVGAHRRVRRGG